MQFASDLMPVPKASMNACTASDPFARVTSGPGGIPNKAMNTLFFGRFYHHSLPGFTTLDLRRATPALSSL